MKFTIKASNFDVKNLFDIWKFIMQKLFAVFLVIALSFANGYPFEGNLIFFNLKVLTLQIYF